MILMHRNPSTSCSTVYTCIGNEVYRGGVFALSHNAESQFRYRVRLICGIVFVRVRLTMSSLQTSRCYARRLHHILRVTTRKCQVRGSRAHRHVNTWKIYYWRQCDLTEVHVSMLIPHYMLWFIISNILYIIQVICTESSLFWYLLYMKWSTDEKLERPTLR